MKRTGLLAVLAALLLTAPAQAGRMPAPPHVWAHHEANPACGEFPCADQATGEIWLPAQTRRFDLFHEVGHIFDAQVLTDANRAWLISMLDFDADTPWLDPSPEHWVGGGAISPGERFADAYAACSLGMSPRGHMEDHRRVVDWETAYGYYPTARRHQRICNALLIYGLVNSSTEQ